MIDGPESSHLAPSQKRGQDESSHDVSWCPIGLNCARCSWDIWLLRASRPVRKAGLGFGFAKKCLEPQVVLFCQVGSCLMVRATKFLSEASRPQSKLPILLGRSCTKFCDIGSSSEARDPCCLALASGGLPADISEEDKI